MMRLSLQVGALNKGHVKESADSFTLGAHRDTTHHGQQASGSLASDAAHLQTDVVTPLTAYGVSAVVEAEPALATAVDLADSDCSTEDAFDKTSAHSSGSPETAAIDGLPPVHGDTDSPTAAASSSGSQPSERHASTAEAGSSTQPSSDDSSAGAAHDASNGADQLAARGAVSSGDEGSQPTVSSFPRLVKGSLLLRILAAPFRVSWLKGRRVPSQCPAASPRVARHTPQQWAAVPQQQQSKCQPLPGRLHSCSLLLMPPTLVQQRLSVVIMERTQYRHLGAVKKMCSCWSIPSSSFCAQSSSRTQAVLLMREGLSP